MHVIDPERARSSNTPCL